MNKKIGFSALLLVLVATVAYAAGYDQINSGWLKIGQGTTATKKLEFNVGNTTNDPIITGDSSNNLNVSASALRLLERPANGTNYIELVYSASMAANKTLNVPEVNDWLVTRTTTDTLTNKDISSVSNIYRDATASVSGQVTTSAQTFAGAKTFTGDFFVAPSGATTTFENTNGGGTVSLTSPVVSLGANDNSTTGSGSMLFSDTVGGSFNLYFLTVNSAGSKIRTAHMQMGGTTTAGAETGTFNFLTKPSSGTAVSAFALGSDKRATFGGAVTMQTTRGTLVSDSSGDITASNIWTSSAMTTSLCTTGTCSSSVSYGGGINSITWSAVGTYDVNFTSSFWSAGPVCTVSGDSGIAGVYCGIKTQGTTTKVVVECATTAGSDNNLKFSIICAGTRS